MNNINIKKIGSINTKLLAVEAMKRGIKVDHINYYQREKSFLELTYKKHKEYLVGEKSSKTAATASYIVENKALTKTFLSRAKINITEGKLFDKDCDIRNICKYAKRLEYPVVVKKYNGAHGDLIFLGVNNEKKLKRSIEKIFKSNNYVLIEKNFQGKEFRFIASRNKVFAVMYREPANVIGDSKHNIKELIKIKNSDPRRGSSRDNYLTKIIINSAVRKNLAEQNINLNSVVPKDKKVFLKNNSNLSTGGDSYDVTDIAHRDFKKIAIKAVCAVPGLAYAGIDLMISNNISQEPEKNSYVVIEINSSPAIRGHHHPFKGKSHNVAKEIIDILFPETISLYR